MTARFRHVAIVARDVDGLRRFYIRAFGCEQSGPRRGLQGRALAQGMGLEGAHVRGVHLRLPGHGTTGPVLEIFALDQADPVGIAANRLGLMHLAFEVDDLPTALAEIIAAGGSELGTPATVAVPGVETAQFVYARDPEENIIELKGWLHRDD